MPRYRRKEDCGDLLPILFVVGAGVAIVFEQLYLSDWFLEIDQGYMTTQMDLFQVLGYFTAGLCGLSGLLGLIYACDTSGNQTSTGSCCCGGVALFFALINGGFAVYFAVGASSYDGDSYFSNQIMLYGLLGAGLVFVSEILWCCNQNKRRNQEETPLIGSVVSHNEPRGEYVPGGGLLVVGVALPEENLVPTAPPFCEGIDVMGMEKTEEM